MSEPAKFGDSFQISREALQRQSQAARIQFADWREEQARVFRMPLEEREAYYEARRVAQFAKRLADWRAVRARYPRVPATLEAVCEKLDITPEMAEHFSQPYCTCMDPFDSESSYICSSYYFDTNPPQEDQT